MTSNHDVEEKEAFVEEATTKFLYNSVVNIICIKLLLKILGGVEP